MKTVTVTGIDDNTDLNHAVALAKAYPFVEYGILVSSATLTHSIVERYPRLRQVHKIVETFNENKVNYSIHLCGRFTRAFMNDTNFGELRKIPTENANRIQINYSAKNDNFASKYNHDLARELALNDFLFRMLELQRYGDVQHKFILQYNNSNRQFIDEFLEIASKYSFSKKMIMILRDSSGGRGRVQNNYNPLGYRETLGYSCGFSGGISPENIKEVIPRVKNNYDWIDMENGVRTGNWFDLRKVEEVLIEAKKYING